VKFFGFSLDLCFDKIAEDFWVDCWFNVDGHCCILGGGAIKNNFQFLCHCTLTGKGFEGSELTGPTFGEEFFRSVVYAPRNGLKITCWMAESLVDVAVCSSCGRLVIILQQSTMVVAESTK